MSFVRRETEIRSDRPILFNQSRSSTPFAATLSGEYVNQNAEGNKEVPAGMFVCRYNNITRYVPRAEVTTAAASGASTIQLGPTHLVIVPGDDLFVVDSFGSVALDGTYASGDTIVVTVDGFAFTFTVGTVVTLSVIATNLANAINNSSPLYRRVEAKPSGTIVYLFSKTSRPYTLTVDKTSTAGTVTKTDFRDVDAFVGRVASINTNGLCTLESATTFDLPLGAKVGRPNVEFLGVDIHSREFKYSPTQQVAPYYKATGVFETNLPYVDWDIKNQLPDLNIRKRF